MDVIIPTRNRAALTIAAVESVRAQTVTGWHLYLVDDASDDGSFEELTREFREDPRITILRHERPLRAARARQTGFEAGSAPWVATLDSDDVWLPQKLEVQLAVAAGRSVVLGWHSWIRPDGSTRVTRRPSGEGSVSPLLSANVDVVLMRRDLVERVGGFAGEGSLDLIADENVDFFIRLLSQADVVVVPEVVALCRDHPGSRTSDGMTPDTLATIVEHHRPTLAGDPGLGELLCRLGARHLRVGQAASGWSRTVEGLRAAPAGTRWNLLREYGPHAVRQTLAVVRRSRSARRRPE